MLVKAGSITLVNLPKEYSIIDTITGPSVFFNIQLLAPSSSSPAQFSHINSNHINLER